MRNGEKDPALWTMEWAQAIRPPKKRDNLGLVIYTKGGSGMCSSVFMALRGKHPKTFHNISP